MRRVLLTIIEQVADVPHYLCVVDANESDRRPIRRQHHQREELIGAGSNERAFLSEFEALAMSCVSRLVAI